MTTTLTPAQAWEKLFEGTRRFVAGTSQHPNQDAHRRAEIANGQNPFATFLGCSDSRVAAETLFDVGLGDLFTTRNAGHMVTESAVASIEFAIAILEVPLLIVLAHDSCGAVAAAVRGTAIDAEPIPPKIWKLIAPIVPSARRVLKDHGGTSVSDIDPEEVGREHLRGTIEGLMESSEIISTAVAEGRLAIVGAKYRLTDGTAVPIAQVGLADSDIPSLSKEPK